MFATETDYLEIGCSPCDEPCVQLGSEDYDRRAKKECRALINQLKRMYGEPPESARLTIKGNPHDYGVYFEVRCIYAIDNEAGSNYALKCESLPENWDEEAKKELNTDLPTEFQTWEDMTRHYN